MKNKSLAELKQEAAFLRKKKNERQDMLEKQLEKKKLKKEIQSLKRPNLSAAISQSKSIAGATANTLGSGLRAGFKRQLAIGAKEAASKKKPKVKVVYKYKKKPKKKR